MPPNTLYCVDMLIWNQWKGLVSFFGMVGTLACPWLLWSMPLTLQIQAQGEVTIVNTQAAQDAYITPDPDAESVSGIYVSFLLPQDTHRDHSGSLSSKSWECNR